MQTGGQVGCKRLVKSGAITHLEANQEIDQVVVTVYGYCPVLR